MVKKAKPRSLGWGARNRYMRAKSLVSEDFKTAAPGVGDRGCLVVGAFCACLGLFMDISRISGSVEFKRLFRII